MFSIVNVLILLVVLVIATIFIYKIIYTHKINQRIQAGEVTGRKLVDVSKMVMIAVIVGLIVYAGILMYVVNDYAHQEHVIPRNNYAVIDVSEPDNYKYVSYFGNEQLDDASFAKVYNKDANEGYEKEVIESEPYVFTVFKRTTPADSFHPDFLCFAEFVGEDKEKYMCYGRTGFQSITEETDGFYGESSGEIEDCLLYLGYLDSDCQFDITMSLLDEDAEMKYNEAMQKAYEEDKGKFPIAEDYAEETGRVSITIE